MSPWQMWLWLKLDAIQMLCVSGATVSILLLCFSPLVRMDFPEFAERWMKRLGVLLACFTVLGVACPSTKQAALIWAVPALVNSKVVQQDIPEVYELAIEKLKESLGGVEK